MTAPIAKIKEFHGHSLPMDRYNIQILERVATVIQAQEHGFLVEVDAKEDVSQSLRNFSRDMAVSVHAIKISVKNKRNVFLITVPNACRYNLGHRLTSRFKGALLLEFTDKAQMFRAAAPYAAISQVSSTERRSHMLLLAASK